MISSFDLQSPISALTKSKQKATLLSLARILVFFAIAASLILGLTDHPFYLLPFPILFFAFILLILKFNKATDKQVILQQVIHIQKENVLRKSRNLQPLNGGMEFIDKNHPFSSDLDLFGEFSLFQLINHTVTSGGKNLLADWLKSPFDAKIAHKRHGAIKELAKKEEFLITFEATGKALHQKEKSKSFFYDWLASEENFPKFLLPFIFLGPIVGLGLIIAHLFMDLDPSFVGIWILFGILLVSFVFKSLLKAAKALPDTGNIKTFSLWSQQIEKENFDDPYLKHLQQPFRISGIEASKVLKDLEQINFLINNRINLMYLVFNLLFWLDLPIYFKLLIWKKKYGSQLSLWEKTFEEWQVLVSLAAFEADEQQHCDILWAEDNGLCFQNIRHPLIEHGKAVGNDFTLNDQEKVVLLTGANMSGKTTFMRTLGINLVMAHLGLTPFADTFIAGNFQLYTSMRNSDNLGESMSSFYAELSRIKSLIIKVERGENMFFLLDEILKGTNTSDRIMGSKALILQLSKGAKGIISTHDIELSQLEQSLPFLVNKSFHSEIQDHEIRFDYKIKDGACPNFNAQKLMELMGIRLENF